MAQMPVDCYRYGHHWSTWMYSPILPKFMPMEYIKDEPPQYVPMKVMASRQCVRCGVIESKEEER